MSDLQGLEALAAAGQPIKTVRFADQVSNAVANLARQVGMNDVQTRQLTEKLLATEHTLPEIYGGGGLVSTLRQGLLEAGGLKKFDAFLEKPLGSRTLIAPEAPLPAQPSLRARLDALSPTANSPKPDVAAMPHPSKTWAEIRDKGFPDGSKPKPAANTVAPRELPEGVVDFVAERSRRVKPEATSWEKLSHSAKEFFRNLTGTPIEAMKQGTNFQRFMLGMTCMISALNLTYGLSDLAKGYQSVKDGDSSRGASQIGMGIVLTTLGAGMGYMSLYHPHLVTGQPVVMRR